MKNEIFISIVTFLLKLISGIIPVAIAAVLYFYLGLELFWIISFYFVLLNRNVFEVYELSKKIYDSKEEENKLWKNILMKRKKL